MRTLAVRRCALAFPFIRWRGNVFRPRRPVRPWRTGLSGRDWSDPPVRGPGTGSRPGVLAHHPPRPPGVAPAPAIPPGRVSSAASRRRRTRWPTAWPSGCSASPSKTGTSPVTARRSLPARDCWMGVTPQRRGRWGCTSPSSPMPIEACRDGGSLPTTASLAGSASALRWPWRNPKPFRNLRNRCRARPKRFFLHIDPDVTCAPLDRHRARRKPPSNHRFALDDRDAPGRPVDGSFPARFRGG